jgi:NADH dehydrogenase [ubiquinone] 1 alpha subcomplex assembly factor 7
MSEKPLENLIRSIIQQRGQITVGEYMTLALGHPQWGYYMSREPFGTEGDFTTAPEVSQLFGEMIGVWVITQWERMGKPKNIQLVELGPGRGTLMHDILRAIKVASDFKPEIHLVEFSPRLKQIQSETLQGHNIVWHEHFEDLPNTPSIIVANEFFDALPIEQAVFHDGHWFRRVIIEDDGDLMFSLDTPLQGINTEKTENGTIYEYAPMATMVMEEISSFFQRNGGALLAIDYGDDVELDKRTGETLQAIYKKKKSDVLEHIGKSDLTAHVSFASLALIATEMSCAASPLLTQAQFLTRMGIRLRAEKLMASASDEQKKALQSGLHRLVDVGEMGDIFKVLEITA